MNNKIEKTFFENGIEYSLGILDNLRSLIKQEDSNGNYLDFIKSFIEKKGIQNILMDYKNTIDGKDFSSHNREQCILGLATLEKLKERDNRRYFTGSVPYANYIFNNFLNTEDKFPKLEIKILNENNPLISKYNDIFKDNNLTNLEKKFKFITEYINEVSHSEDAAGIGGMSGATDFLQLYKYVMMEEIINKNDRIDIIKQLFKVLKIETSGSVDNFIKNYNDFIELLKQKNINDDKRLSRLYNRLYFIFSFVLNNQKPEEFPIYFSATRNTLRIFGIEGYENVVEIYKEFLNDKNFDKYIKIYLYGYKEGEDEKKGVLSNKEIYSLENIFPLEETLNNTKIKRIDLFENHAKYRFFQDICWVLNRNVLDGQDYINNNYVVGNKFNFNDLKDKKYLGDITFGEIINIKYLIDEGYIKEISTGEYEVIKIDDFYIGKTETQQ